MSKHTTVSRRHLLAAVLAVAGVQLGLLGTAQAQTQTASVPMSATAPANPGLTTFKSIKQIDAGVLNVGYVDEGPADGPVVILLHGWPYDIYSFVDVVPLLTKAGYRVIVPYLRGYGTTRFLDANAVRNGEPAALASDVLALMDALKIDKAILAGYDWGARTADIVAALWPERVKGLVSVSGYLIGSQDAGKQPLPPSAVTFRHKGAGYFRHISASRSG